MCVQLDWENLPIDWEILPITQGQARAFSEVCGPEANGAEPASARAR